MKQRKETRVITTFPVIVTVKNEFPNISKTMNAETVDLSEEGLGLSLDEELLAGNHITAKVDFSPRYPTVEIMANIIWQNYFEQKGRYYSGFRFIDVTKQQKEILRNIIGQETKARLELNPNFIDIIKEFRRYLIQIQNICSDYESSNPSRKEKIKFIEIKKDEIFKNINKFFNQLDEIIKKFSLREYKIHQQYLQDNIKNYFFIGSDTPMNTHIYEKPLGYPGDYITMNYLYGNKYLGKTTYGMLISRYSMELPVALAHINRKQIFQNYIKDAIKNSKGVQKTNIASFACGPAIEIVDFVKKNKNIENVSFHCIDAEKRALKQITDELKLIQGSLVSNVKIYKRDILKTIKNKCHIKGFPSQDLIYSSGFMDYLSDMVGVRLIKYLLTYLKPGGRLIIVNISSDNPMRSYLEMTAEWYLHHRSEKELLGIAKKACPGKKYYVNFDPDTKMNLYLVIENE